MYKALRAAAFCLCVGVNGEYLNPRSLVKSPKALQCNSSAISLDEKGLLFNVPLSHQEISPFAGNNSTKNQILIF